MDTLGEVFRELDYNILIKTRCGWYEWVIRAIVVVAIGLVTSRLSFVIYLLSRCFRKIKTDCKLALNLLHYYK